MKKTITITVTDLPDGNIEVVAKCNDMQIGEAIGVLEIAKWDLIEGGRTKKINE